jgi:hypothetical protein
MSNRGGVRYLVQYFDAYGISRLRGSDAPAAAEAAAEAADAAERLSRLAMSEQLLLMAQAATPARPLEEVKGPTTPYSRRELLLLERKLVAEFLDAIDACTPCPSLPTPPAAFFCPISLCALYDPVVAADEQVYEMDFVSAHYRANGLTSPKFRTPVLHGVLMPVRPMRSLMHEWSSGAARQIVDAPPGAPLVEVLAVATATLLLYGDNFDKVHDFGFAWQLHEERGACNGEVTAAAAPAPRAGAPAERDAREV